MGNAVVTTDERTAGAIDYARKIWQARYFWTHLALSDLRTRWRRSFLGALWSLIQPLAMTALLTIVFSRIFQATSAATRRTSSRA